MDNDVEQVSLIIDFEGWGLKNRDHDLDKMMIDTIQNYYPERLGQCFIVNAPTVFKVRSCVTLHQYSAQLIVFAGGVGRGSPLAGQENHQQGTDAPTLTVVFVQVV